ncbi:TPA: hypothetical protein DCZ16_03545 [Candidatus Peregrinibacteria bacterium]|nr:hypothetical protein [Candidatus Peregrinibacteria bacterium]
MSIRILIDALYNYRMKQKTLFFILPIIIIFSFLVGWEASALTNKQMAPAAQDSSATISKHTADLSLFWDIWDLVSEKFIDEKMVVNKNMVYGAIKGLTSSLEDPYTVFLTPDETKDFNLNLNGDLEGIGAELTIHDQTLTVVTVLKNSPAENASLRSSDIIYKIDNKISSEMTLFDAIKRIRGKAGTVVNLVILRKNAPEPIIMTITRANIEIDSISYKDKGNGIFHISINHFSDRTTDELNEAINQILMKDPKGLILDVRSNGGGYLDIAVEILSEFIKGKKSVVYIKKRDNKSDPIQTDDSARLPEIPLVVLMNGGSASASEIVAGAIQDLKRGILIGEKSFGKGSVQEYQQFADGSSLRVTIAKWLTPDQKNIDETGIKPDIEIKMTEDDYKNKRDPQLNEAVKYLKGIIK